MRPTIPIRFHRRIHAVCAATMLCTAVATAGGAQQCDATGVSAHSQDLYCVELVPAPAVPSATGTVALGWEPGPFSVAVNADGMPRYVPTMVAAGLPAPGTLGAYTVFVAWLATPTMSSVVRLGVVRNGRTRLPVIALDKFLLLVTAETKSSGSMPSGLVVLRGFSPSTRLQPPELMQFALGATRDTSAATAGAPPTHTHGASGAWSGVPMPQGVQMLPAEMALRPAVEPYLPFAPSPPPAARRREVVHLETGDTLYLLAGLVSRTIKGRTVTMFGFNGQYPGPLIDVAQGAEISVEFTNALDQPTTVHWHGIRLANRFDGVPELTQDAVPPGGRYSYQLRFPDAGIYWYHPHVREDAQQDLGLYGNLLVRSPRADYFTPAHREEVLMLDDLLVGDGGPVPYGRDAATHALMGRFGNVMLVNGEPNYRLHVRRGEVLRLYLTNVSNTRTLNLSFPGARLKVVGSDVGNFEREAWVHSVVIAPAERYVVLARFDRPGETPLVNRVRALDHLYGRFFDQTDTLATVLVAQARASPDLRATFDRIRTDTATRASLAPFRAALAGPPAKTLILTLETRGLPFLTRQLMQLDSIYFPPVEWSGTMPSMNWAATTRQVRWVLRDADTGHDNMSIDWQFARGTVLKLRLVNDRNSLHAMQHPIHLHGQRFLIAAVNGIPNTNLVWKDTALVPAGAVVDIVVDLSNPGRWMLHCHIAEHLSADMMMAFVVH